jgi:glycosyltransferase involved in cell wall biosynthesis
MKILYSAIDQSVPAAHGGSVHVTAVAEGLAGLGHDVHALITPGSHDVPVDGPVTWIPLPPPFGDRRLRLFRSRAVLRHARAWHADVIIERYYNFGGEGILAARRTGALAVLEVNAPVVDFPGSRKQWIDRMMLVQPLRRWRDWQCANADLIVTPSIKILPPLVPPERVLQTEWGADTDLFHPGAPGPVPFARRERGVLAVFAGAFRAWHGAMHLVEAIRQLRERKQTTISAVLIGGGPELPRVRRAAVGIEGIIFTGALPHAAVPACLAAADIGVAPFDLQAHPTLAHEFHWSPLKIFEYMASGLPVVAPRIPRLAHVVRNDREGLLYDPADPRGLASALERLTDATLRAELGAAARRRAVEEFSWSAHCQALDRAIRIACHAHTDRH